MDNITYIDFPNEDNKNEGDKVAKFSEAKRDNVKARYNSELAKLRATVTNSVPVSQPSTKSELDNLEVTDSYSSVDNTGVRKLKVGAVVRDKALKYYVTHKKEVPVVNNVTSPLEPQIELPKEEVKEPIVNQVSDTRMSRLERTGEFELPTNLKREDIHEERRSDVINAPSRFVNEEKNPEIDRQSLEAFINEDNKNVDMRRDNETRGGDPNLYNKLIHGENDSSVSLKLQDAKNRLLTANEEKEKARVVNANLEAEVENVRATIERIKRERNEKVQKELDNTLNMLQTAKEEILSETRKYDNLQQELSELMRQRDALLSNDNYQDNNYKRSM